MFTTGEWNCINFSMLFVTQEKASKRKCWGLLAEGRDDLIFVNFLLWSLIGNAVVEEADDDTYLSIILYF